MRLELGLRFEVYIQGFKSLIKTDQTSPQVRQKKINLRLSMAHAVTRHVLEFPQSDCASWTERQDLRPLKDMANSTAL
jgi:hypothetical protein